MNWNPTGRRAPIAAEDGQPVVASSAQPRGIPLGLTVGLLVIVAVFLGVVALTLIPGPEANIAKASQELSPASPVTISLPIIGVGISGISLSESVLDDEGHVVAQRPVPVELVAAPQSGGLGMYKQLQLQRTDGNSLLEYDRLYQLKVSVDRTAVEFPLPRATTVSQDYSFRTLTTPKVVPAVGVAELKYQKPAEVHWTSPIQSFSVEVTPQVQVETRVDPARPSVGLVDLVGATPGQQYQIQVVQAKGANGAPLISTGNLSVLTAAPPKLLQDGIKLVEGERVVIPWDRKVASLNYTVSPQVQSVVEPDSTNPATTVIRLVGAELNKQYTVNVTGAVADNDAPMTDPQQFQITTPPPLEITKFRPKDGSFGVLRDTPVDITFSDAIKDRKAAEAAISVVPAVPGRFEWPEPNHVRFVPQDKMPTETNVTVHFASGPSALRGVGGGYMPAADDFAFKTAPNKVIDVDLTKQKLTLLEGGAAVFTTLVSTGVAGAETPTGTFKVDYKMLKTRMKGTNPSGHTYDLPDVPWVMSFLGDYTLHGAYWRDLYGTPQSNGCVSMPPEVAKQVYDWTPEGTPVIIHY